MRGLGVIKACARWLLCALWLLQSLGAWADSGPGQSVRWSVLEGLAGDVELDAVMAEHDARFSPLEHGRTYRAGLNQPLWLKARLGLGHSGLQLQFPTVIIDRYEVYQRTPDGVWRMEAAGDRVPHRSWPVDSLRPRFDLVPMAAERDVYVRVVHQLPLQVKSQIVNDSQVTRIEIAQMIWIGLLLGVTFSLLLACAQMTVAYRDTTYAWYAGYLIATCFAALAYSGVAQRYLWPQASKFASDAVVYGVMGAMAFNLQFTRAMFGSLQKRAWHVGVHAVTLLCVLYALVTLVSSHYAPYVPLFGLIPVLMAALILYAAINAVRKGVRLARLWLLIYVPYLLAIVLTALVHVELVPLPWWPEPTPVVAASLEIVAMMLLINAYSRQRHAEQVRSMTAAQHDPLTGFLNASEYTRQASQLWQTAQEQRRHLAIVQLVVEPGLGHDGVDHEALMARSVRLVRSITREFDLVGRLGRNRLGLVMTDLPAGEALRGRLSRLIALGLMRETDSQTSVDIRFRIVAGTRELSGSYTALDHALKTLLGREASSTKPIQFITRLN